MQEIAGIIKTDPMEKKQKIEEMSKKINNPHIQIQSMAAMEGFKLKVPLIRAKKDHPIDVDGNF
jgi:hypothetical protein